MYMKLGSVFSPASQTPLLSSGPASGEDTEDHLAESLASGGSGPEKGQVPDQGFSCKTAYCALQPQPPVLVPCPDPP